VVEVADTFVEKSPPPPAPPQQQQTPPSPIVHRFGGRVTAEEVLDAMFAAVPVERRLATEDARYNNEFRLINNTLSIINIHIYYNIFFYLFFKFFIFGKRII
jgi:hypothetical protein